MAINFPNNPAVNDTFTVGGTTFNINWRKWESSAVVQISSDTTPHLVVHWMLELIILIMLEL